MLPKSHRLPGYRIPDIIQTGQRTSGPIASIIAKQSSDSKQPSTITVIVPVRLSKKAAHRSRTKRLLREAVHGSIEKVQPGYEVIVMAQRLLTDEKLQEVEPAIHDLLLQAKLIAHPELL